MKNKYLNPTSVLILGLFTFGIANSLFIYAFSKFMRFDKNGYVIYPMKELILNVITFGIYGIYWTFSINSALDACEEQGRYIFSSMGTGNKLNGGQLQVADIYSTSGCALARVMRRELKARGVKKLPVVFSAESRPAEGQRVPATIAYMPAIAGLMIAEQVGKRIFERDKSEEVLWYDNKKR